MKYPANVIMQVLSMLRHFFKGEQMRMELDGLFRSNKPEQLINLNISLKFQT